MQNNDNTKSDSPSRKPHAILGVVYSIRNIKTGHVYIGQTVYALQERWQGHLKATRRGVRRPLYDAIREHGESAFVISVIGRARTRADLNRLEQNQIRLHDSCNPESGYNRYLGGSGSRLPDDCAERRELFRKERQAAQARREEIEAKRREAWKIERERLALIPIINKQQRLRKLYGTAGRIATHLEALRIINQSNLPVLFGDWRITIVADQALCIAYREGGPQETLTLKAAQGYADWLSEGNIGLNSYRTVKGSKKGFAECSKWVRTGPQTVDACFWYACPNCGVWAGFERTKLRGAIACRNCDEPSVYRRELIGRTAHLAALERI